MATTTYGTPYVQSSDLVSSYPGTSSTLATRVDDISLKANGLNDQTGTTYTLVLTDGGKTVTLSNASAVAVTIPANASVAFPTGTIIRFVNKGAGTVTISPTGGVTLNGGNLTLAQYAGVQIIKLATDTWGLVESITTPTGMVPVSATSIANTAGTASKSGAEVTFANCTAISVNGVFTSTYSNYFIALTVTSASASVMTWMRLRAAGTDTTTGYNNCAWYQNAGGAVTANTDTTDAIQGFQPVTASGGSAQIWVMSPNLAQATFVASMRQAVTQGSCVNASQSGSTQFDGFTFYNSTTAFSGKLSVYGISNS